MAISSAFEPGQLINRQRHRRLAVERAGLVVAPSAELDAGHVFEPHQSAPGVGLDDHLGELLGIGQATHRADRELEHLAVVDRRLTDLAGCDLGVLLLDRA